MSSRWHLLARIVTDRRTEMAVGLFLIVAAVWSLSDLVRVDPETGALGLLLGAVVVLRSLGLAAEGGHELLEAERPGGRLRRWFGRWTNDPWFGLVCGTLIAIGGLVDAFETWSHPAYAGGGALWPGAFLLAGSSMLGRALVGLAEGIEAAEGESRRPPRWLAGFARVFTPHVEIGMAGALILITLAEETIGWIRAQGVQFEGFGLAMLAYGVARLIDALPKILDGAELAGGAGPGTRPEPPLG